ASPGLTVWSAPAFATGDPLAGGACTETSTESVLDIAPSLTVTRKVSTVSAVTAGATKPVTAAVDPVSATAGPAVCVQVNDSGFPSASELADASRITAAPPFTDWSGPAAATGGTGHLPVSATRMANGRLVTPPKARSSIVQPTSPVPWS